MNLFALTFNFFSNVPVAKTTIPSFSFPIIPSSTNDAYPSVDSITNSLKENFTHVLPIDATKLALDAGNVLSLNITKRILNNNS